MDESLAQQGRACESPHPHASVHARMKPLRPYPPLYFRLILSNIKTYFATEKLIEETLWLWMTVGITVGKGHDYYVSGNIYRKGRRAMTYNALTAGTSNTPAFVFFLFPLRKYFVILYTPLPLDNATCTCRSDS